MKGLRFFALLILSVLLAMGLGAVLHEGPASALPRLARDPWFIVTVLDARLGALGFWIWIAYKEGCGRTRFVWLVAILFFGNVIVALYLLVQLARLPADAKAEDLLLSSAACRLRA